MLKENINETKIKEIAQKAVVLSGRNITVEVKECGRNIGNQGILLNAILDHLNVTEDEIPEEYKHSLKRHFHVRFTLNDIFDLLPDNIRQEIPEPTTEMLLFEDLLLTQKISTLLVDIQIELSALYQKLMLLKVGQCGN